VVYGFPVGGDGPVTRGVVSRVEHGFLYGRSTGTILQVSAAINPGNSGGPAVVDGRMVGLAFSRLGDAENIGYVNGVDVKNLRHLVKALETDLEQPRAKVSTRACNQQRQPHTLLDLLEQTAPEDLPRVRTQGGPGAEKPGLPCAATARHPRALAAHRSGWLNGRLAA
jgi:hypothetical protein